MEIIIGAVVGSIVGWGIAFFVINSKKSSKANSIIEEKKRS